MDSEDEQKTAEQPPEKVLGKDRAKKRAAHRAKDAPRHQPGVENDPLVFDMNEKGHRRRGQKGKKIGGLGLTLGDVQQHHQRGDEHCAPADAHRCV